MRTSPLQLGRFHTDSRSEGEGVGYMSFQRFSLCLRGVVVKAAAWFTNNMKRCVPAEAETGYQKSAEKKECLFLTNKAIMLLKTKGRENEQSQTKPIQVVTYTAASGAVRPPRDACRTSGYPRDISWPRSKSRPPCSRGGARWIARFARRAAFAARCAGASGWG